MQLAEISESIPIGWEPVWQDYYFRFFSYLFSGQSRQASPTWLGFLLK